MVPLRGSTPLCHSAREMGIYGCRWTLPRTTRGSGSVLPSAAQYLCLGSQMREDGVSLQGRRRAGLDWRGEAETEVQLSGWAAASTKWYAGCGGWQGSKIQAQTLQDRRLFSCSLPCPIAPPICSPAGPGWPVGSSRTDRGNRQGSAIIQTHGVDLPTPIAAGGVS